MGKIEDLKEGIENKRYKIKRYKKWMKETKKCYVCGKEHKKMAIVMENGNKKFLCCNKCLLNCGYEMSPEIMKVDEKVLVSMLVKGINKMFTENKALDSIEYIEDKYNLIIMACNEIKKDAKEKLDKELSFNF